MFNSELTHELSAFPFYTPPPPPPSPSSPEKKKVIFPEVKKRE